MSGEKYIKWLGILRRLGYFSLVFWPGFLLAGLMTFDAPNSYRKIYPYIALIISFGYGTLPFIAPKLSQKAFNTGHVKVAYIVAAIPFSIFPALFIVNYLLYIFSVYATKH